MSAILFTLACIGGFIVMAVVLIIGCEISEFFDEPTDYDPYADPDDPSNYIDR